MIQHGILQYILIQFGIPMKLVWLIRICFNEAYNIVCIGKHLSDIVSIQNGLKLLSNCHYEGPGKLVGTETE
jgi:hypothetical protein